MSKKDQAVPRVGEGEAVDLRSALMLALTRERETAAAVVILRGAVEAESRLRGAEARAGQLEQRAEELERELPTLVKRVADARAAAAVAETSAREAYSTEAATVRQEIGDEQVRLAEMRQRRESESRELEATYAARQQQLAEETGDLERKLARLREEWAALVGKHAG